MLRPRRPARRRREPDGRVHGLLPARPVREPTPSVTPSSPAIAEREVGSAAYEARVEAALDALAEQLERELDLDRLLAFAGEPRL